MTSDFEEEPGEAEDAYLFKPNLLRVWLLLKHELAMAITCLVVMVLRRWASLMENVLGGLIIDCFQRGDWDEFWWQTVYLSLSYLAYSTLQVLENFVRGRIETNITRRCKIMLYNKLIYEKSQAFYDEAKSGELAMLLTGECEAIGTNLSSVLPSFISELFEMTFGVAFMLYTNWKLTGAISLMLPAMALATWFEAKLQPPLQEEMTKLTAKANAKATEAMMYVKTVRIFGQQKKELDSFISIHDRIKAISVKLSFITGLSLGFISMSYHLCIIMTFWYGGVLVLQGVITSGQFLAFNLFAMSLSDSVNYLPELTSSITVIFVSTERVFSVIEDISKIDLKLKELADKHRTTDSESQLSSSSELKKSSDKTTSQVQSPETTSRIPTHLFSPPPSHRIKGLVKFENVHFSYPTRPNHPVLQDFNLTIQPGQSAAVVGSSGGGKSTIVSILTRFYDISAGSITIDGIDISTVDPHWLRKQIGLVSQEPVLFSGTIRDNICYGLLEDDPEMDHLRRISGSTETTGTGAGGSVEAASSSTPSSASPAPNSNNSSVTPATPSPEGLPSKEKPKHVVTQERLEQVAKMANAHDFISELPEGYDTDVGERGSLLSAGQRQRIAIARALLRDPKILITDEATSALDNSSERVVQQALERLMQGRTCLVIAHRLSTIRQCYPICYIGKGRILEMGSHFELLALPEGHYAKLHSYEEKTEHLKESMELMKKEEILSECSDGPIPEEDAPTDTAPSDPLEASHQARSRVVAERAE